MVAGAQHLFQPDAGAACIVTANRLGTAFRAPSVLDMIERGIAATRVWPSLDGIKRLACVCKQTVVNCLKVLTLYGFVLVHRRIKRIRTALGFKVVQDTNAYTLQEAKGLGQLAASIFKRPSESRKWAASSTEVHPIKRTGPSSQPWGVPDGIYGSLYAQWEAT